MQEFHEKFEIYVRPLRITEQEYLKGIFLNGLKEEVRAELKLQLTGSLSEMMYIAQLTDEKNQVLLKGGKGGGSHRTKGVSYNKGFSTFRTSSSDSSNRFKSGGMTRRNLRLGIESFASTVLGIGLNGPLLGLTNKLVSSC